MTQCHVRVLRIAIAVKVAAYAKKDRFRERSEFTVEAAAASYIAAPRTRRFVVIHGIERQPPEMYISLRRAARHKHRVGDASAIELVLGQHAKATAEIPSAAQLDVVSEGLRALRVANGRGET